MPIQPDNAFLVAFGKHVASLRKERGYSILELKDRANLSRAQMYRIEAGLTNVSLLAMKQLADALEVPVSTLTDFRR